MKKFKLMALALIIGVTSLFAANNENTNEINKKMRSEISNLLPSHTFNLKVETIVTITFTFSFNGEVVVLNVDSSDRNILNYVHENLNYKKIENFGKHNKLYTILLKVTSS